MEHRQRPPTHALAPVKTFIHSQTDPRKLPFGCNRYYVEKLSALDGFLVSVRALYLLTKPPGRRQGRRGDQLFDPTDHALPEALQKPRVNIASIRWLALFDLISPARFSRQLLRLCNIGVIKRVRWTYRCYLARIGRAATAAMWRETHAIIVRISD